MARQREVSWKRGAGLVREKTVRRVQIGEQAEVKWGRLHVGVFRVREIVRGVKILFSQEKKKPRRSEGVF